MARAEFDPARRRSWGPRSPIRLLEALRTIHSFDPRLACAIHTVDVDGRELAQVRAL